MKILFVDMKDGSTHELVCVAEPKFLGLVVVFFTKYGPVEFLQDEIKGIRKGSL